MSEEQQGGFFSQLKNQIITTIGIIITAAGGLLVTNMEKIFSPEEVKEEVKTLTAKDSITPVKTEVIVIKEVPVEKKPKHMQESTPVTKTETEKRKEEGIDW